jgi:beta-glucanase (GH16 family)
MEFWNAPDNLPSSLTCGAQGSKFTDAFLQVVHRGKPGTCYENVITEIDSTVLNTPDPAPAERIYHDYGVLWTPDGMHFMFDGEYTGSYYNSCATGDECPQYPFDGRNAFYLITNQAVGGSNLNGCAGDGYANFLQETTQVDSNALRIKDIKVYTVPANDPVL